MNEMLSGTVDERANLESIDVVALQGSLGMQPGELSEDELTNINEENVCHKKDDVPGEETPAKSFVLEELFTVLKAPR